jgi:ZU5 domain
MRLFKLILITLLLFVSVPMPSSAQEDDILDYLPAILAAALNTECKIIIGPQGGDFNLPNGITLSIPSGAISEATTFIFRTVKEKEFSMPTEYFRQYEKHFLAGIEAKPYGYTFYQPISISIPSSGLVTSTSLPYPLSLNTATSELDPPSGSSLQANAIEAKFLQHLASQDYFGIDLTTITVKEDGSLEIPGLTALPKEQQAIVLMEIENFLAESDCVLTPCRCGRIKVESEDFDSASNENSGCYSVYSDGFVQYLDCPGQPIEPWSLHESNIDVKVTPNYENIQIGGFAYFSISLTNEKSQPVTDFSIRELNIKNPSVISEWYRGVDFIGIKGLSPGISSAEVVIQSGGCQYKGWLTVEVVAGAIVLASNKINIPEGGVESIGVKLSEAPPVAHEIIVSALVGGDNSISVILGMPMSFNHSSWDSYQYLLIEAEEDDLDAVNGTATITFQANDIQYASANLDVEEIDNDQINFVTNAPSLTIPEGATKTLWVKLNLEPPAPVTASVSAGGDISASTTLLFNSNNWDTFQAVSVTAGGNRECCDCVPEPLVSSPVIISGNGPDGILLSKSIPTYIIDYNYSEEDCAGNPDGTGDPEGTEPWTLNNRIFIELSRGGPASPVEHWSGVIPILTASNPDRLCSGYVQGAGILNYYAAFSYLSYDHLGEGTIIRCHYHATGYATIDITGTRDGCMKPAGPEYLLQIERTTSSHVSDTCEDGWSSDWTGTGSPVTKYINLDPYNGYNNIWGEEGIYNYHNYEILNKGNL